MDCEGVFVAVVSGFLLFVEFKTDLARKSANRCDVPKAKAGSVAVVIFDIEPLDKNGATIVKY